MVFVQLYSAHLKLSSVYCQQLHKLASKTGKCCQPPCEGTGTVLNIQNDDQGGWLAVK